MKTIRAIFILFVMLVISDACMAQGQIRGTVKDETGSKVEFVMVTLLRHQIPEPVKKHITFTDTAGQYYFTPSDTGQYYIKITGMGYLDYTGKLLAVREKNDQIVQDVILLRDSKQLDQVVIQGRKSVIERKADRLIFNVDGNSAAAGSPLLDVLRMVPGLSVTNDKLNIRGKEGLTVMIDNRRTYMSGDDLVSYLKNTPAESISQIEVITNPSARYDAEGNVGIINIKTKWSTLNGTTGTLTQSIGYGKYLKSTTGGQVTYTGGKLTLFGNSYLSYNKSYQNYYAENNNTESGLLKSNNYSEDTNKNNYSYQAGLEYQLNTNSTIGALLNGSLAPDYQAKELNTVEKTGSSPQHILTNNQLDRNNDDHSVNLHYNWANPKSTDVFSTDINYFSYNYDMKSAQLNNYYSSATHELFIDEEQLRNSSIREVDVLAGKADYSHKWQDKHTLESGVKWSRVQTNSDLIYEELTEAGWVNDQGRTNQYKFDEQIYAGYLNYNGQFGTFTLQTGLRAEQTVNTGFSKTLNNTVKRDYIKLFPSVFIGDTFLKNHSWSVSYSYRVDRPTYSYLNPFTFINNPYSYFRGNPYLQPQYTHNFEGNYDFKKLLFVTLGYSKTTDMITVINERGEDPDVIGGTRINLNAMDSYNITFNAPFKPLKGWDINIYAGGFKNIIKGGEDFSNQQTTFTASFTSSTSLPAGIIVDLNGSYQSAMSYGTVLIKPMYSLNTGIKKSFLANQLSVRINVSDVLNIQKMKYQSDYDGINVLGLNKSESRITRLSLSYKFGKIKTVAKRNTGVEDEQSRARQ